MGLICRLFVGLALVFPPMTAMGKVQICGNSGGEIMKGNEQVGVFINEWIEAIIQGEIVAILALDEELSTSLIRTSDELKSHCNRRREGKEMRYVFQVQGRQVYPESAKGSEVSLHMINADTSDFADICQNRGALSEGLGKKSLAFFSVLADQRDGANRFRRPDKNGKPIRESTHLIVLGDEVRKSFQGEPTWWNAGGDLQWKFPNYGGCSMEVFNYYRKNIGIR